VRVHVTPRARSNEVRADREAGLIRIRVIAPPADGKANEAVLDLLRERLGVGRGGIRIIGGATARRKWIEAEGITEAELWRRLEADS
jgi:uncharacterized protein YggU (UPF0235/DUF167 family)